MPINSAHISDEKPFFDTLADLDARDTTKAWTVLAYSPRRRRETRGRLLVCHDFKGGYSEDPSTRSYTFNFWPFCDVFVYFSHHRVTVPPAGWTTAAHRQGVKMLGTLIFEHQQSAADCLQLLFGKLPASKTGSAAPSSESSHVPISPHYARLLADLAHDRGFDGYLLNFEWHLQADGGVGHARAVAAWIAILQAELKRKVGPHAEVIWYDSVVVSGQVRWQDRLNGRNLPFFVPSTGFFTNYTWGADYPLLTAQYFANLDPALTLSQSRHSAPKTLQDVYVGIDVFGRGSHGGGGFGSYKALEHIEPSSLGLSAALFGQGWTWESEQDNPGWSWDAWWEYDRKLWLGPASPKDDVPVPVMPPRHPSQPECTHGPYRALCAFFPRQPPPDPLLAPFCTTFSPGVGFSWFVSGVRAMGPLREGWTDIDKQTSLGDMLWPRPELRWEDREDATEPVPSAASALAFEEAWMGGNSLRVAFEVGGSEAEDAFFRCVWIPVQSFVLTAGRSYDAEVVLKSAAGAGPAVDLDVGLTVKLESGDVSHLSVSPVSSAEDLAGGWTRQALRFTVSTEHEDGLAQLGLVVGFATEDPSQALSFSLLLGQLAVHPSPPPENSGVTQAHARLLWADFERAHASSPTSGVLTWDLAAAYPPIGPVMDLPAVEDPTPLWVLDTSDAWFPAMAYYNVYAKAHGADGHVGGAEDAVFVGTTGWDGRRCRFQVERQMLPEEMRGATSVRYYVQGVTDRGEVMRWDRCVFVDAVV
ncbi:glycosyl hydrolase family 85-domain-containing protein [Amylostereum chailletii]|nr:glycosyl hydrolase family 85-domain-containing protein [Amylostereum chailletii]